MGGIRGKKVDRSKNRSKRRLLSTRIDCPWETIAMVPTPTVEGQVTSVESTQDNTALIFERINLLDEGVKAPLAATGIATAVLRRMARDIAERGRDVDGTKHQIITTVLPMYETYVKPTHRNAHFPSSRRAWVTIPANRAVEQAHRCQPGSGRDLGDLKVATAQEFFLPDALKLLNLL